MRALRFLDTLLQRDSLQKAAFLKDLANFWPRFDARVLRFKVPHILAARSPLFVARRNLRCVSSRAQACLPGHVRPSGRTFSVQGGAQQ